MKKRIISVFLAALMLAPVMTAGADEQITDIIKNPWVYEVDLQTAVEKYNQGPGNYELDSSGTKVSRGAASLSTDWEYTNGYDEASGTCDNVTGDPDDYYIKIKRDRDKIVTDGVEGSMSINPNCVDGWSSGRSLVQFDFRIDSAWVGETLSNPWDRYVAFWWYTHYTGADMSGTSGGNASYGEIWVYADGSVKFSSRHSVYQDGGLNTVSKEYGALKSHVWYRYFSYVDIPNESVVYGIADAKTGDILCKYASTHSLSNQGIHKLSLEMTNFRNQVDMSFDNFKLIKEPVKVSAPIIDTVGTDYSVSVQVENDMMDTAVGSELSAYAPTLILAAYDDNGRMVNVTSSAQTTLSAKAAKGYPTSTVTVTAKIPKKEGQTVKGYVWQSATDMTAFTEPFLVSDK